MSMKAYASMLTASGFHVRYFDAAAAETAQVFQCLKEHKCTDLVMVDPVDYLLERRYRRYAATHQLKLQLIESPQFITTRSQGIEYFRDKKKFFLTDFYIEQRKRLNLLIENGQPTGGRWTFDTENRKRLPKGLIPPVVATIPADEESSEAVQYVNEHFASNPGNLGQMIYPYTRATALQWLDDFLSRRFKYFGEYQDAIVSDKNFLFHSLLTPMLNVGLITPDDILQRSLTAAQQYNVPLNSLEGFIRQILGWREFIRHVYVLKGTDQRTTNFWEHKRKIPPSFYNGTTGIEPVDEAIKRCIDHAYTHHIERLMVLGNFMLLCEFDPDEVYRWFMELFIDSYDWVMVPNVYGMSQFADGGSISTKPYISGSNYILKMSNYKKGPWCEIWDALFWRFIHIHKSFFLKNPRMSMMVRQVEKMDTEKFNHLMQTAGNYLLQLDREINSSLLVSA